MYYQPHLVLPVGVLHGGVAADVAHVLQQLRVGAGDVLWGVALALLERALQLLHGAPQLGTLR